MSNPNQQTESDQLLQQEGLPVIDIEALWRVDSTDTARQECVHNIGQACRHQGFFYIVNHGIDVQLERQLEEVAEQYFSLTDGEKREIAMAKGGLAWRGSFLVGDELTSGIPDQKEGVYYGEEDEEEDEGVGAGGSGSAPHARPLRGKNLFHNNAMGRKMRDVVHGYMAAMKLLGDLLMQAVAASLGLRPEFFGRQFDRPTQLFRMFHYPPHDPAAYGDKSQAVGEHTDYGYLTILKQDQTGGLQVKRNNIWVEATPIAHSFVVNLGDALQHNTGGLLRATPHRVKQRVGATGSRYSFPFFYDPSFDAQMQAVSAHLSEEDKALAATRLEQQLQGGEERWDAQDPRLFEGTYGQYLLKKVAKVFPLLAKEHALS